MKKIFVFDTSVIVSNPKCFFDFKNDELYILIEVLEELDKLKKQKEEIGKNARQAIRIIDELSINQDLTKGIKIDNNCILKAFIHKDLIGQDENYADNKILAATQFLTKKYKKPVILLTRDINLRIRARALGLTAEDYESKNTKTEEFYSGITYVENNDALQELMEKNYVDLKKHNLELFPNQCIVFEDSDNNELALARKVNEKLKIVRKHNCWGITPKNNEQSFLMDMILDPNLSLVSVMGSAGSGKTLVSVATCLELVLERKLYEKLVIIRPNEIIGKDLGFLPGSLSEKKEPLFGAVYDAFEFLFESKEEQQINKKNNFKDKKQAGTWRDTLEMFEKKNLIELDIVNFYRGSSKHNCLYLLDEAQNFDKHTLKSMLTRMGENSKMILTGDIEQIDNKFVDMFSNGLTQVIHAFQDSELAGHVTLSECLRSPLANEAVKRL